MKVYDFIDKTSVIDVAFEDYVTGKSIAIVGRSGLDDLEQGEFIDSHDVVVRCHWPHPNPGYQGKGHTFEIKDTLIHNEWQSRIGKRCNILYHKEGDPKWADLLFKLFQEAGGKFLCVTPYSPIVDPSHSGWRKVRHLAPHRFLTTEHLYNSWDAVGTIPMSGALMLCDLLRFDIKSLYLTGFPTWHQFPCGTLVKEANIYSKDVFFLTFNWLRALCQTHDGISTDKNMRALFSVVPDNWDKYKQLNGIKD